MTGINITSGNRPLIRITFGGGELILESNLGESAAAQAIGDAMQRLGKLIGPEAANLARAEVEGLRAQGASTRVLAQTIARMVSEVFGNLGIPEVNVDLQEWAASDTN